MGDSFGGRSCLDCGVRSASGASFLLGRVRRDQTGQDRRGSNKGRVDKPTYSFLRRRTGWKGQADQLGVRAWQSEYASARGLESKFSQARRPCTGGCVSREGWKQPGERARHPHARWSSGIHWGGGTKHSTARNHAHSIAWLSELLWRTAVLLRITHLHFYLPGRN
jgi:hypothetical protein